MIEKEKEDYKAAWIILTVISSFLLGWIWATYIANKDMSQFGTQLHCTQQGDPQK